MIPNGKVNPRGQRMTDEELRMDLVEGLSQAEIARKHGISEAAVSQRVRRLKLQTTAAAVAPAESQRYVNRTIDAAEELLRGLARVNKLQDACHEWLRHADHPELYDLGPRIEEVEVTYHVEITVGNKIKREKRKASLASLLRGMRDAAGDRIVSAEHSESKHADPRELILKTCCEVRQTVQAGMELARMLSDQKALEALREGVLEELRQCDPEMAARVATRIRRRLALRTMLGDGES